MSYINYYETLQISLTATQSEIKQAYRRLVKLFHPDSQAQKSANNDKIIEINAAYEILGDEQKRKAYDQHLLKAQKNQQTQNKNTQTHHKQKRKAGKNADEKLEIWLKQVYIPVNKFINQILNPFKEELNNLSYDPFDDELMAEFQLYLQKSRHNLNQAVRIFQSLHNPSTSAGIALNLYYCLNQISDGIEELERFTYNYDDHYLHTGQELFRIANHLRSQAQDKLNQLRINN